MLFGLFFFCVYQHSVNTNLYIQLIPSFVFVWIFHKVAEKKKVLNPRNMVAKSQEQAEIKT